MRKCLLPLLLAALTMTFPVLSADEEAAVPDGVICPPGGPCILPSAGGAAAAEAEPLPANLPDT